MSIKVKIKARGEDAKELLGQDQKDKVTGGKEQMKENPESRQAEGKNASEKSETTKVAEKTLDVPTSPEARNVQGFDTVKPVNRERHADSPEAARQRNNMARDARTNLGRGKSSTVVVD